MLSHDVLPSPALLDFLREQALSKTPQSGGSLCEIIKNQRAKNKNRMDNKRIFELIRNLGLALTDYEHIWTNELRKEYEEVTTYLSSC
ncbi:hypothetical protein NTJ28_002561 [Flavobacterium psychrophilum]|nr:hypothetical protein [Flavobacterium psychrophilum]